MGASSVMDGTTPQICRNVRQQPFGETPRRSHVVEIGLSQHLRGGGVTNSLGLVRVEKSRPSKKNILFVITPSSPRITLMASRAIIDPIVPVTDTSTQKRYQLTGWQHASVGAAVLRRHRGGGRKEAAVAGAVAVVEDGQLPAPPNRRSKD